jgi:hypothetical protein
VDVLPRTLEERLIRRLLDLSITHNFCELRERLKG